MCLSRYDLLNKFSESEENILKLFKYNGVLGNPCIDSQDVWIFKSPIKKIDDKTIVATIVTA